MACTQEIRLFNELSTQTEAAVDLEVRPIRFVNIRETGGWGREASKATPKLAALLAVARMPEAEPVPTVTYRSEGRLLIIGPLERAEAMASLVNDALLLLHAAEIGCDLVTGNVRDFDWLDQLMPGHGLILYRTERAAD